MTFFLGNVNAITEYGYYLQYGEGVEMNKKEAGNIIKLLRQKVKK